VGCGTADTKERRSVHQTVPACDPQRRAFLGRYCETNVRVLTAHSPSPSIGLMVPETDAFRFA